MWSKKLNPAYFLHVENICTQILRGKSAVLFCVHQNQTCITQSRPDSFEHLPVCQKFPWIPDWFKLECPAGTCSSLFLCASLCCFFSFVHSLQWTTFQKSKDGCSLVAGEKAFRAGDYSNPRLTLGGWIWPLQVGNSFWFSLALDTPKLILRGSAYDATICAEGKAIVKTDIAIAIPEGCYGRIGWSCGATSCCWVHSPVVRQPLALVLLPSTTLTLAVRRRPKTVFRKSHGIE